MIMENMQNTCRCVHHKVIPVLVILFGLTFLLGAWGILSSYMVDIIWPILVIIAGGTKLGEKFGMCKCCQAS